MCGVVGIVGFSPVNQSIYNALIVLQHRGQDAAGMVTIDENNYFRLRKANGLVQDVFQAHHMQRLQGNIGIGHVCYPTAGSASVSEAQPFYVNSPYDITLAHNGNLTNTNELRNNILKQVRRHVNTNSDSEVLLNIVASELDKFTSYPLAPDNIFSAIRAVHNTIIGASACVTMIIGYGLIAFRDPDGMRPLVLGKRVINNQIEYMVACESVALDTLDFELIRDVQPGEVIYITQDGQFYAKQCADKSQYCPYIFEYIYFARPDSLRNSISVYHARILMGKKLGRKIAREWKNVDIDVVIPILETSCDAALEIARILNKSYRQSFVKNRYVGRTFIMPGQTVRRKSVRRKLNANRIEFEGKSVLLVDDSVVRGTTSQEILEMVRLVGAKKVYLASASPEIRYPSVHGIDMPVANELVTYHRSVDEIAHQIGADKLIFQDLDDLIVAVQEGNPILIQFECSVFDGKYITGDITESYLANLPKAWNDKSKGLQHTKESENL